MRSDVLQRLERAELAADDPDRGVAGTVDAAAEAERLAAHEFDAEYAALRLKAGVPLAPPAGRLLRLLEAASRLPKLVPGPGQGGMLLGIARRRLELRAAPLGLRELHAIQLMAGAFPAYAPYMTAWHGEHAQAVADAGYFAAHGTWPFSDDDAARVAAWERETARTVQQASHEDAEPDDYTNEQEAL